MKRTLLLIFAGLLIGAGLGVLILAGLQISGRLAGIGGQTAFGAAIQSPQVGRPAPDFELLAVDGEPVRLSDLHGKPVLINFWATWCGPCITEMPTIQAYYKKHAGKFEVLAVNADESERDIHAFVEDMNLTFPILLDPGSKVQNLYRLRGYPTTYLVDAEGVIRVVHIGGLSEAKLEEYLAEVGVDP